MIISLNHWLYLTSSIILQQACKYFLLESGFALFIAFWINVAIISVSGTVCSSRNLTQQEAGICSDLTLNNASVLLQNVLGRKTASIFYGIALFASGQSSTITGTYAGQYIMQVTSSICFVSNHITLLSIVIWYAPLMEVLIVCGNKMYVTLSDPCDNREIGKRREKKIMMFLIFSIS